MTYKINETNLWILAFGITHKIKWLKIYHFLSFLRKQESMFLKLIWIPAGAGMTTLPWCHKSIFMVRACLPQAEVTNPSCKIYLDFGLPARSRFGEGRCLEFGDYHFPSPSSLLPASGKKSGEPNLSTPKVLMIS